MVKYLLVTLLSALTLSASDQTNPPYLSIPRQTIDEKVRAICDEFSRKQEASLITTLQEALREQNEIVKETADLLHDANNTLAQIVRIMQENEKKPQENVKKSE